MIKLIEVLAEIAIVTVIALEIIEDMADCKRDCVKSKQGDGWGSR